MSSQVGLVKVKGSLDGVSFYESKGKMLVRMSKGPSKGMIEKSPKYKEFRENRTEFVGSMKMIRALRHALEKANKVMFDGSYAIRAGKVFRLMINKNPGARGKRPVQVLLQKAFLEDFELNGTVRFKDVFKPDFAFTADATRTTITLTVADFLIDSSVTIPEKATHFTLQNVAGVLSEYVYDADVKGYVPSDKLNDTKNGFAESAYLPLTGNSGAINVATTLNSATVPDATSAVFAAIGIQFYEYRGAIYYPLTKNALMKIAQVF